MRYCQNEPKQTLFFAITPYFVVAWGVAKNVKWLYPLTTALLIVNALGTIFDDVGVIDVVFMVANTLILILLLNYRKKLQKVANDSK